MRWDEYFRKRSNISGLATAALGFSACPPQCFLTPSVNAQRLYFSCSRKVNGVTSFIYDFRKAKSAFVITAYPSHFQCNLFTLRIFHHHIRTDWFK